jgi:hypothetical protein
VLDDAGSRACITCSARSGSREPISGSTTTPSATGSSGVEIRSITSRCSAAAPVRRALLGDVVKDPDHADQLAGVVEDRRLGVLDQWVSRSASCAALTVGGRDLRLAITSRSSATRLGLLRFHGHLVVVSPMNCVVVTHAGACRPALLPTAKDESCVLP